MKKIALLGSTGSIGRSTESVIDADGDISVVALASGNNVAELARQAQKWKPLLVAIADTSKVNELKALVPQGTVVVGGKEGLIMAATLREANLVVSAIVGFAGLEPTLAAAKLGKTIALANKEVLVAGGELFCHTVEQHKTCVIPVDSEHSALFQCLEGNDPLTINRLILTASGGPFRERHDVSAIRVEEALKHPNWNMGPKVTIDSSTLMNKGLEVIEAHFLFGIPYEQIEVVIHPQSIVHSMIEFSDHNILAHMGPPKMVFPIRYALHYPHRLPCSEQSPYKSLFAPLDFGKGFELSFLPPDTERFRCLKLAFAAGREGGLAPCYLNAANEVLVSRFLQREISWVEIGRKLEALLQDIPSANAKNLSDVIAVDQKARVDARSA